MKVWYEVQHKITGLPGGCPHHNTEDWHNVLVISDGWDVSKSAPLLTGLRADAEPGEEFRFVKFTRDVLDG